MDGFALAFAQGASLAQQEAAAPWGPGLGAGAAARAAVLVAGATPP